MIPLRSYLDLLSRYLRPLRARVALLAALLLSGLVLQVWNPQIVKQFIDAAVAGDSTDRLIRIASVFIAIAVLHQASAVAATYFAETVGWTATNRLRRDLAAHLLQLDMGFHKSYSPGELIERIDGDVTALSKFFSQFVIHVAGNALLVLGVLVLLLRESLIVGTTISALALVAFGVMVWVQRFSTRWWQQVRARRAEFFGFLGEQLGGTEDVRGNGAVAFVKIRFHELLRDWLPFEIKGRWGWSTLWGTNIVLFAASTALIFWLGARLYGRGELTLGSVYLIYHYAEMIRHPLERIRTQMEDLQKAGASIGRVEDLLALETRLTRSGTRQLDEGALSVEFDAVEFHYGESSDSERVLHDVSFRIEPGKVVGVLGRTGSGKTTIARLVARLYDPECGRVLIGGFDAREVEIGSLRGRIGMVTQDVQLFRATVRDNLTFFDPSVGDDRLWRALRELGIDEWVASLPDGLDTMLDAGSGGLSAGEAQLLAFARIFLKDPGIVILDEASSRLDPATEKLTERAASRLLGGRTGLVIAHRLATVDDADDILILADGVVMESGSRQRLAADPDSRFSQLRASGMAEVLG